LGRPSGVPMPVPAAPPQARPCPAAFNTTRVRPLPRHRAAT
jgi:hypothetical protein